MNERILKIARQVWPDPNTSHVNHMKFAELMVEEACQAFWSEACNVSDLAYEDYHRNSKKIRQHFGVEL